MSVSISYCVSVADEHLELDRLLTQLGLAIDPEDEVIVLADASKITQEVSNVINVHRNLLNMRLIGEPLNGDFARFKNNFIVTATKDYIMQIDCDELLSDSIFLGKEPWGNLKWLLEMNPEVDMYAIPRENYVTGLTQEYVNLWRWRVDDKGRVNFPDAQMRIFRNGLGIRWQNKIHEILINHKKHAVLPNDYYLIHTKSINKQVAQNEFYNSLLK